MTWQKRSLRGGGPHNSLSSWSIAVCLLLVLASQAAAAPTLRKTGSRIVGGQDAPVGRYPYQVLVLPGEYMCGGSLIADRVVVTAAHCTYGFKASQIKVQLGRYFLNEGTFEERKVSKLYQHASYSDYTVANDISLLYLDKAVQYKTIKLATAQQTPVANLLLRVIGWGKLSSGAIYVSETLQQVDVPVVDKATCNGTSSYNGGLTASMFCAGLMEGGKDSCQGDSGGPIFTAGSDSNGKDDVQYGLVSFGSGCADANYPGVYTSIAYMRPWITARLKDMGYKCSSTCSPCQECDPLAGCIAANENGSCTPAQGAKGECQSGTCVAVCPSKCLPCQVCDEASPENGCQPSGEGDACTMGAGGTGTCSAGSCLGEEIDLTTKKAAQVSNRTATKGFEASKAIDGDYSTLSSTKPGLNPWWHVDLGSTQEVKSVSIFLRTNNGTYAYSSNKNKGIQGAQVETLRITVGNTLPTPTKVGGDILNTIVFDNSLDLSVQGTTISFLPTATGRYVALQLRGAGKNLDLVEVRVNMELDSTQRKTRKTVELLLSDLPPA